MSIASKRDTTGFGFTALILLFALSDTPAQSIPCITTIDSLIYDMTGLSESVPNGVTHDWGLAPRRGGVCPSDWNAVTTWGQVYIGSEGSPAVNVRVHIRNNRTLLLSATTGLWSQIQYSERVDGAAYIESFEGDQSVPADVRDEPDGGVSVKLISGYNFHFWPVSGRATFDPSDMSGIIGLFEARLIVDRTDLPDDRSAARIVAAGGGDYWRSLTAQWSPDWDMNFDWAIGKHKYVGNEWRVYTGHTLTEQQLRDNPPPIASCATRLRPLSPTGAQTGKGSSCDARYYTIAGRQTALPVRIISSGTSVYVLLKNRELSVVRW